MTIAVEQIQLPVRNPQLVHGVDRRSARAGALLLAPLGRLCDLPRRRAQRRVELHGDVARQHREQERAERDEHERERADVPRRDAKPQPPEHARGGRRAMRGFRVRPFIRHHSPNR